MNTAITVSSAIALFIIAVFLTVSGKSVKGRIIKGGIGGLSLLCAISISASLTGLKIGLNALTIATSLFLGVPGVFAVIGLNMII